jgi:dolichol-phosphate mannosyltransferase
LKDKFLIVIPAFNCKVQLVQLLNEIRDVHLSGVRFLVVDNRSTDGTFEHGQDFLIKNSITHITIHRALQNNSLGGTHKIAFLKAISEGYDYVGIFHGDGQGSITDLCRMIEIINQATDCESLLGSRFSHKSNLINYSKRRIFGNKILNLIYSILTRRILTDLGSGVNIFKTRDVEHLPFMKFANALTFNYELILWMCRSSVKFSYTPITWRDDGQVSNARNYQIFYKAILIALKSILHIRNRDSQDNAKYGLEGS